MESPWEWHATTSDESCLERSLATSVYFERASACMHDYVTYKGGSSLSFSSMPRFMVSFQGSLTSSNVMDVGMWSQHVCVVLLRSDAWLEACKMPRIDTTYQLVWVSYRYRGGVIRKRSSVQAPRSSYFFFYSAGRDCMGNGPRFPV